MEPLAAGDPETIGPYRLHARLGLGGMGRVYLGFSPGGRAVAVKTARPELAKDAGFRRRFHSEVAAARRVSGAYTAPVIGAGPDDDPPWLATVFVPGPSLADFVASHGVLPEAATWKLAAGLVEAIQAVHGCGVIHRDLKPGNVLLAEDGPRVIDFGISRALDGTSVTSTNLVVGTAPYMSPEQAEGMTVGPASDVFSLGAVITFGATGAAPFGEGSIPSVLYRIVHTEPAISGIPVGLRDIVAACLTKEPSQRPGLPTLAEMLRSGMPYEGSSPTSFWPDPVVRLIHAHKLTFAPEVSVVPEVAVAPEASVSPEADSAPTQTGVARAGTTPASGSPIAEPPVLQDRLIAEPPALPDRLIGSPPARPTRLFTLRRAVAVLTVAVAAAVGAFFATSGGAPGASPGGSPGSGSHVGTAYDAALTRVVNPSTHAGGTLTLAYNGTPDSLDPGDTYSAWVWNFSRLYATPLITYRSCPGSCGLQLVPGLATSLGQESANGLTWTYHLKRGVTFEDGTPVTAQDIKYAVERTYDRQVLQSGPTYFQALLTDTGYPGPYTDRTKNLMGLTSVTTPDDYTIQFHLQQPFPDFNYVAALPQTAPVPPGKDTGANYQLHPISTGPYMFQDYTLNKQATLVRNPHWKQFYDTEATQLPSKIVINLNTNANTTDDELIAGTLDMDAGGSGVQATTQTRILSSPALKTNADDALNGEIWFAYINTKVAPLNNLACREAVEYAANKTAQQTAYGGPIAGGAIASTLLPPDIPGYQNLNLYEATTKPSGDLAEARQELAACGHPNGFTTGLAYPSDDPKQVRAAQSLQVALARVGIKLQLHGYTLVNYYASDAGVPTYVHQHDLGIDMGTWGDDWPDGYAYLYEITNGNTIVSSDNTNIEELNDSTVNSLFGQADNPSISASARTDIWAKIDLRVISDAAILPEVYSTSLLYRNPDVTNVYVDQSYGMYNYAVLGVK